MNDVMDALAAARPQSLDPAGPSAERRYRDLEAALSQPVEHTRRRSPRRRLMTGLAGVVAVGTAATVAIVATDSGRTVRSHGTALPATNLDARTILLTAADKASAAPTGRYWRFHTIMGQAYHVGPASGGYTITGARMEIDQWLARDPKTSDVFFSRFAGARPQTAADRTAWQSAGSPTTWQVLSNGQMIKQTSVPERWDRAETTPAAKAARDRLRQHPPNDAGAGQYAALKAQEDTRKRLDELTRSGRAPDPAEIAKLLVVLGGDRAGIALSAKPRPRTLIQAAYSFLVMEPVSPAVRAVVFRLLAKEPGLRNAGTVTDLNGRKAIAVATRVPGYANDTVDYELLLDPHTYQVMGNQEILVSGSGPETSGLKPGTIFDSEVVVDLGWTDETPHHD